jgi:transposase-like protein
VIPEQNKSASESSKVVFKELDSWLRVKIQDFIQQMLEEEVSELLVRVKGERRQAVDSPSGYRNGYGKARRLTTGCGTVTIRRPRVRNLDERFESRVLPLFERRTQKFSELIPELYLHGLSQGDFDLALRGLLGADAPLSAATVARLKVRGRCITLYHSIRKSIA